MRIESMRIQNFRSFEDQTIYFDDYSCIVGANGAGKSTILNALNVFFREYKESKTDLAKLSEDDFHHKNTDVPVTITLTFSNLSDQAKSDFSDYVRQEKLIISSKATYSSDLGYAEVKQYGNRLGFDTFRRYFEADKGGASAQILKDVYSAIKGEFPELPNATTKARMAEALKNYEAEHSEDCILIPSEDEFYGVSKGVNKLEKFVQWIFIPASKDATEESEETKNSALSKLLERTVRAQINFKDIVNELKTTTQESYQGILDNHQSVLDSISDSLQDSLSTWSHPDITAKVLWKHDSEKSVRIDEPFAWTRIGERGFEADLARFGHGMQRSFLLALLQELSTINDDENTPTLIMGIEEPEIYQHPPQAKYLSQTLCSLAENGAQVIICTHSPQFIPNDNFESVRVVREKYSPSKSYISQLKYSDLNIMLGKTAQGLSVHRERGMLAKLYPSLNPLINEMFFCNKIVLTEGIEDVAYIYSYLMLTEKMDVYRKNGCHILPVGGKDSIIKPLAMAKLLEIPVFVVCDADTNTTKPEHIQYHKRDNSGILKLMGYDLESDWPTNSIFKEDLYMWKTNLTHSIEDELGGDWIEHLNTAYTYYGSPGGLRKNPLAIAKALECAWGADLKSASLINLVEDIINFITR